ncbi:hypothetical protein EX30DRAFT_396988 [Ascodesmis nigricans]|uniref:Rhodopsin domain-containing protein n=1 Tax=Ascodesmis nigricans TaxID=341454 RepID=A0A4S2MT39_9PEZI|nr:hypothetical protein EX30DRAFT_396988 [Ascodesmis nigricans]
MSPEEWLATMTLFTAVPSIFIFLRLTVDVWQLRNRGYARHAVVGAICAAGAWISLVVAVGMVHWRNQRAEVDDTKHTDGVGDGKRDIYPGVGKTMMMEAMVLHSLVVPTGLWLVKGSFVAMYYKISRHLSRPLLFLLHSNIFYLIATYLVHIITHSLWCNTFITSNPQCSPFASTFPIGFYAFLNITSDLLVMITPILLLRRISVSKRAVRGMVFLGFLGLGMVATAATCCYFHLILKGVFANNWQYVRMAELLAIIELGVGLMAVALPSIRAANSERRKRRDTLRGGSPEYELEVSFVDGKPGESQRASAIESEVGGVTMTPWEERENRELMMKKFEMLEARNGSEQEIGFGRTLRLESTGMEKFRKMGGSENV